jgi:sec-independent protein translocase protein TatB
MFDVGFWELVLVSIVGLLVLGPERLPRVVRTAGQWIAQARSVARRFQREIEREIVIKDLEERYQRERAQAPPPPPPAGAAGAQPPGERAPDQQQS